MWPTPGSTHATEVLATRLMNHSRMEEAIGVISAAVWQSGANDRRSRFLFMRAVCENIHIGFITDLYVCAVPGSPCLSVGGMVGGPVLEEKKFNTDLFEGN